MSVTVAQYPRPDHFILHFSDTHFVGSDDLLYDAVDSEGHLLEILADLTASGARPEAIVFTGDLADKGDPKAYEKLRAIVEPAAAAMGAEVIWVMGNHDNRAAFRAGLLDQLPSMKPIDRVYDVNGLRIITLDSTVPGSHHGEISHDQLDWLAEELASPAPHGTILALHHPPVPSVLDLAVMVELRDQASLAEVILGSDVRSIIAGHLHYSSTAIFAGVPVSVASATCYTQDLNVPVGGTLARDGAQAFNLIHVYENTVLHSVVPIGHYARVSYTSAADTAAILEKAGVEIAPAVNPPVPAEAPLVIPALVVA
ncbi:phosphodiesterase [Subtercola frigoramans]|uniref:3',5'-cyclic AMP phosphodiesterase CpdA n=1 Tax=Subtercola frigoramans TaxID=120298 RepID=A0ABS2L4H3_9MICO|nr:phosphodiesterase [Subtercola frigoramans]MBM7471998.1 3',5'-cyclic AMP phosphodiesterase CpdA [Subtercola frigoramans]